MRCSRWRPNSAGSILPAYPSPREADLVTDLDFEKADRILAKKERKIAEAQERLRAGMRTAAQKRMIRQATAGAELVKRGVSNAVDEAHDGGGGQRPAPRCRPCRCGWKPVNSPCRIRRLR